MFCPIRVYSHTSLNGCCSIKVKFNTANILLKIKNVVFGVFLVFLVVKNVSARNMSGGEMY